ncbi:MAG: hypothetical protein QXD28_03785 [Acidilobaceae archaeon]
MGSGKVYTFWEDFYAKVTIAIAFVALLLGGIFGVLQVVSRTPYFPKPI